MKHTQLCETAHFELHTRHACCAAEQLRAPNSSGFFKWLPNACICFQVGKYSAMVLLASMPSESLGAHLRNTACSQTASHLPTQSRHLAACTLLYHAHFICPGVRRPADTCDPVRHALRDSPPQPGRPRRSIGPVRPSPACAGPVKYSIVRF